MALLALAFLVVPLLELYVIIQVGQVIGAGWTIVVLLAISAAGAWLVRHEGQRAWQALRTAIEAGRMPDRELADGALLLIGGTLLLTPGFLTDVVGFFLLLPVTRPLARRWLAYVISRRVLRLGGPVTGPRRQGRYKQDPYEPPRVVPGEVVRDEDQPGPQT